LTSEKILLPLADGLIGSLERRGEQVIFVANVLIE
jgi:hypothetical protein